MIDRGCRTAHVGAKKISSRISACTAHYTGGIGSNGLQMSMPWLRPPRRTASNASSAPPRPGARGAPSLALLLCRRLLGTPLSAPLVATLDNSATGRWLEATALRAMTAGRGQRDPHDTRFGTTRGSLSTFLLSRSWRYRLAELKNHLINQTDVLTLPLPWRLHFLYPILRLPLWAWRHARHTTQSDSGPLAS
jgi:hypothetical protein